MNAIGKKFTNILKSYVRGEKFNISLNDKVTWANILEESREHCVDGIVYSTIKWDENTDYIDNEMKDKWKNDIFAQSTWGISNFKKTCFIFNEFNKRKIEFIALKGFIIRSFYKRPEHRIMSDIDILIHKEDLEKISSCLYDLGYRENGKAGHHIDFISDKYPKVEVHWKLVNKDYFKGQVPLENELWENVKEININGIKVLQMSIEDILVHLCLHMAVHIAVGGFGVRQLLDIAMIVNSIGDDIDWEEFNMKTKKNNVEKFSYLVFLMCNNLFDTVMPKELEGSFQVKKEELDIFIDDILKNGVNGKRDNMYSFKSQAAFDLDEDSISNNVFKRYLEFIFPPLYKMSDKYSYAKKFKVLVPIAWIHHLINGFRNKNFNFKEKVSFFTINILKSYKKNKLLKWLNL